MLRKKEKTSGYFHRVSLPVMILILCLGIFFLGKGLYIPVKAFVAQVLLEHAWQKTQRGKNDTKPWPWADFKPVASLYFPEQDYRTIVVNGASYTSLAFAPGHMDGSAPPGEKGNTVIIGHRETHFSLLQHLHPGDTFYLTIPGGTQVHYRVHTTRIINKTNTIVMNQKDDSMVTLITCYPFQAFLPGDKRFVVIAMQC
jgi:sortase A